MDLSGEESVSSVPDPDGVVSTRSDLVSLENSVIDVNTSEVEDTYVFCFLFGPGLSCRSCLRRAGPAMLSM